MGWTIISVLPLNITAVSTSTLKAAINSPNLINLINYTGGLTPFTYSISPTLPDPLAIDSTTGYVTGIPTASADTATYTVTLSDSAHQTTATTIRFAVGVGPGEVSYTTPGTYTFTVPEGVTSISVVTVGGGGGGQQSGGEVSATSGGSSTVSRGSTMLVGAAGGAGANNGSAGGAVLVGTGFRGGAGVRNGGAYGGAGGGAGGYTAVGGDGSGIVFDGGAGGGGGVGLYGGTVGGAGGSYGGGGAGGSGGSAGSNGGGPRGGGPGPGGTYGGGGGATGYHSYGDASAGGGGGLAYANSIPVSPGELLTVVAGAGGTGGYVIGSYYGLYGAPGGKGAVRIIWGDGRSFPSNAS